MALIELIDAKKSFGEKMLFKEANFAANKGEKIAIIGRNGEGKSSFLKALCGQIQLDEGRLIRQNNTSLAMLRQENDFHSSLSVKELFKEHLKEIFASLDEFKKVNEKLAQNPNDKALLSEIDRLSAFIESKDAWDMEHKIERILKEFQLIEFLQRPLNTLSGGQLRRINLCVILLQSPDIMLLDEPSNHLDVMMISFLEQYLQKSKACVIFISHDRHFIDEVATRCLELEEGVLRNFEGNYTSYLAKKAQILASLSKSYETLIKNLKAEEQWLQRGVKARLKRNEGRKERIFKMREEAKKNPSQIKRLKLELERASKSFNQAQSTNRQKMLFECKNLSKSVGGKVLFEDFSVRILQRERIGIVGANGCGKSTLVKVLLGLEKPDSGVLQRGELKIGYFDQARALLDRDKSIAEIFCPNGGDRVEVRGRSMHIYGYLKQFLFPKEFLSQNVSVLSGGEKNRLALALLFTQKYDLLVLDEPTNDLDIATINILEDYLISFEGALLVISHDRYFLDKITSKLFAFEGGKIEVYHTSYTQYLEDQRERLDFENFTQSLEKQGGGESVVKVRQTGAKLSYKESQILKFHPEKIAQLEAKISSLNELLSKENAYDEVAGAYEELINAQKELESLENEYFAVLEKEENLGR